MSDSRLLKWIDIDQNQLWHPFTQMKEYASEVPLIVERGEGCYLVDVEGNRYLDAVSSLWLNLHGHRKREIDQAIKAQIDRISHSTLLGLSHVPILELTEKLLGIVPSNLKRVFYSDSGSTAVEVALKIAFQYFKNLRADASSKNPGHKTRFVTLENAYHGDTIGSVSVGGIGLFHSIYEPLLFESYKIKNFDLNAAEDLFREKQDEIAALIVEPMIQGAAGMLLQPPGFLRGLRDLTRKYKILMIVDEVATGFGRTGKMFACEFDKIEPDLLCLAKGITGGYLPLAATLATDQVYESFYADYALQKTFFHGHSYTGNPLAAAAACANLKIFEQEKVLETLVEKIDFLKTELERFLESKHVKEVRQLGFMVGIELVQDQKEGTAYPIEARIGHRVAMAARKRGVIIRPLGSVLVLMPPLAISKSEIKQLIDAVFDALEETTRAFL